MHKSTLGLMVALSMAAAPALATVDYYGSLLKGSNEVGGGDVDGFGFATLSIDNVANTVSWQFQAFNIDMPLTGAHIHTGPAGTNGGVIVNFSGQLSGSNLFDIDLASITPANSLNFYVNLHTTPFPAGAIRGQLEYLYTDPIPEPGTYAMMLAGVMAVGWMMRRRRETAA